MKIKGKAWWCGALALCAVVACEDSDPVADAGTTGDGSTGDAGTKGDAGDVEACSSSPCDWEVSMQGVINCKDNLCPLDTHSCCGGGPGSETTCLGGSECTLPSEARAECDGPEDCEDGQECCLRLVTATQATVQCEEAGTCMGDFINSVFCHSDDDCTDGKICQQSSMSPWNASCK